MIKENGHEWELVSFLFSIQEKVKCNHCQMRYGNYRDVRDALKKHPERKNLQILVKCITEEC